MRSMNKRTLGSACPDTCGFHVSQFCTVSRARKRNSIALPHTRTQIPTHSRWNVPIDVLRIALGWYDYIAEGVIRTGIGKRFVESSQNGVTWKKVIFGILSLLPVCSCWAIERCYLCHSRADLEAVWYGGWLNKKNYFPVPNRVSWKIGTRWIMLDTNSKSRNTVYNENRVGKLIKSNEKFLKKRIKSKRE